MGLGREATKYGLCNEKRDDIMVGGHEVTLLVLFGNKLGGRSIKIIFAFTEVYRG